MIIADYLKIDQALRKPFYGCHSLFVISIPYKYGFRIIMEVFFLGKSNTAVIALWIGADLYQKKTHYIIALRPLLLHL
jgi:hypothetical protein